MKYNDLICGSTSMFCGRFHETIPALFIVWNVSFSSEEIIWDPCPVFMLYQCVPVQVQYWKLMACLQGGQCYFVFIGIVAWRMYTGTWRIYKDTVTNHILFCMYTCIFAWRFHDKFRPLLIKSSSMNGPVCIACRTWCVYYTVRIEGGLISSRRRKHREDIGTTSFRVPLPVL